MQPSTGLRTLSTISENTNNIQGEYIWFQTETYHNLEMTIQISLQTHVNTVYMLYWFMVLINQTFSYNFP